MRTLITALTLTSALVLGSSAFASSGDQIPANVLEFATGAKAQAASGSFGKVDNVAFARVSGKTNQSSVSDQAYSNSGR